MALKSFSIFFPMYNERNHIESVLDQAEEAIPSLGFDDYEILVVDDGSTDGCAEIVEARAARNHHIKLVRHPQNMGYGAALRTGFLSASREVVFYTDSDLPIDLHDIADALPLLQDADLVIGYRIKRYNTLRRAVYSWIYNRLIRVLFAVTVRDVNFSFKLVHRRVLDCIHLSASTVFIDGQLLIEAHRCGFKIAEMPVNYTPRKIGKSSFDSFNAAWVTFRELMGHWLTPQRRHEVVPE